MQEWELHMNDFVPEDISTIVIEPRKEVVSRKWHWILWFFGIINTVIPLEKIEDNTCVLYHYRLSMRMLDKSQCTSEAHTLLEPHLLQTNKSISLSYPLRIRLSSQSARLKKEFSVSTPLFQADILSFSQISRYAYHKNQWIFPNRTARVQKMWP